MPGAPLPQPPQIDPGASVHPSAEIGAGTFIGPGAIIGENAALGENCRVEAYAIIGPDTRIGNRNHIHHHAVIGTDSQDTKYRGERSYLIIGDGNILREFVTVNRATGQGQTTRIGNSNLLLAYSHVAHNCHLGNGVILANGVQVGGEVLIQDRALVGGLVGIHQFCHIGAHAIIGSNSKVNQDILPFTMADGHPARPRGLNLIGLKRNSFEPERIKRIRAAYRILFFRNLALNDALELLRAEAQADQDTRCILDFIDNSKRGLARAKRV